MPDDKTDAAAAEDTTKDAAGQSTADGDTTSADAGEHVAGEDALGDAGKQALDRMKAAKKEAEQRARDAEAKYAEALAKIEGTEKEFAAEQERRKVEDAALAKANDRIRKAEVRAAAAGKMNDPTDALRYLDLDQFEVGNDGEVDTAAITAAIENLVKEKPYLAAQGGNSGTVFESPGAHRKGAPAGQLTQADLKNMTPAQINTARAEGRLIDLGFPAAS